MPDTTYSHYHYIEKAISYMCEKSQEQPSLEVIAHHVGMSPYYFHRVFHQWAGVSPKKFMQYITLEHAKYLLQQKHASLLETAYETGLSGTGRLHDLFISIEAMTPGEYKNGGKNLTIRYHFAESFFGSLLLAATAKGICHLSFASDPHAAFVYLQRSFPNATYHHYYDIFHEQALLALQNHFYSSTTLPFHLKGTAFQLKIWQSLLTIPFGKLSTYGAIAQAVDMPHASRAVGNAIGANPIALLIPCHRVIRNTGIIGGYRWGIAKKYAVMGWEQAHHSS